MHFHLPSNLQTELIAYDPVLKKLARNTNPKPKTKKSTYPLGNPKRLIPVDVVRESMLDDAIKNINSCPASDRHQKFTCIVNGEVIVTAILYHYEQCWYAAWLPPKEKEDKYVYGYAFAFKDTKAAHDIVPKVIINSIDSYQQIVTGRSLMYQHQEVITIESIRNGQTNRNWNIPSAAAYYQKSKKIYQIIKAFEFQLITTIPVWKDSPNIFDRIANKTNLASIVFQGSLEISDEYWLQYGDKSKWKASYENLFGLITYHAHTSCYAGDEYKAYNKILHIISKPFFKKWIQAKCDEVNAMHLDETNEYRSYINRPWKTMKKLLARIYAIHKIWPDCPIDYYQNHIEQLISIDFTRQSPTFAVSDWLGKHMPVASFFQIITKQYEKERHDAQTKNMQRYFFDEHLGLSVYRFYEWADTISMLCRILEREEHKDFAPPKRWRIEEFHDYVQAEAWKIRNPNHTLPQDLFPTPVKIELGSSNWSFFQPIDTHQLGEWGQAVRNCVGNAAHYAEGVRKKQHFIVLCLIDSKPNFTVQLEVSNGLMSVKQIVGLSNTKLTPEQQELYTTAFGMALQARESELVSA
jgi:hypothetical protein